VYGDVWDFAGFVFCVVYFGLVGAISLLEIIPSFDVIPFFTLTWLIWYLKRKREIKNSILSELEKWK
jgi:hypothetical protein